MITSNQHKKLIFSILILALFTTSTLFAQWFYFGRNKVQYNNFQWHILKTKHFDIYYYPEMEELAEQGAFWAEESFAYLENKFNYSLNRRIPLIFYSTHLHFQQTNIIPYFIPEGVGGFFEFIKGRVVIPCNGNLNQFKKVIRHELVHVFMHSKVYFVNKEHGRLSHVQPPLWFTEGLAEFWSSEWDAQTEMIIKDAVLHNYIVPLSQIYSIAGTYTMYKEGQAILEYIAEAYGDEKLLQFMENLWKGRSFSEVFYLTIGKTYKEFDQEWLYHLKKKYYPKLKDSDFSHMITQTIVRRGFNFKPAYYKSPDGDRVVYQGNKGGYSNIYMTDLKPLRPDEKKKSEIVVKGERSSDFESFHIFSSKIDVSVDGLLTFSSKSRENDALYIYDIDKKEIVRKHQWSDIVGITSPTFSPDGQQVVFSGLSFSGRNDLFLLNSRDNHLIRLTNDIYDNNTPCFSPDGKKIVFSSDRTEFGDEWCYNIFVMDLETFEIHYVTSGQFQDNTPVWSPNGKYIAFTSDRDTSLNIWIADVSSVDKWNESSYLDIPVKRVTSFANVAFDPEWIDDDKMLFAVYEKNQFQIRALGKIQERLIDSDYQESNTLIANHTSWAPPRLSGEKVIEKTQYKKKYQLDIAQSQVSNDPFWGTSGGAIFAFSDILGNDQYYFFIHNNARTRDDFFKSFNVALTKISLGKRTNYAVGLYRYAGYFYNFKDDIYYEELVGGFFTLSYPFSQFKRIEFNTNLSYSDKDVIAFRRHSVLTSNFLSLVHDNAIWSYTGPIEGTRYKISVGNTFDIRWSKVNYWTILLDYRHYIRVAPTVTYAIRLLTMMNQGKETRWFYIGGSWDLRGYPRYSLRGEKVLFVSNELRFPFIEYFGVKFPVLGLGFRSIKGALFFDAGNAWNEELRGMLGSMGFGFRFNLFGFLVLRWDFGRRTDFKTIEKNWFSQFFFGWDF
jgi:Tol biopolymer transport system component